MTVFNLGSINADLFYRVPHLPGPGETLASTSFQRGLGGKGANMSVAAARAGTRCTHIGAVGADGAWAVERLTEFGVDTRHIETLAQPTGHAIIAVDDDGENAIILYPGANAALTTAGLISALAQAEEGDYFVTQNETVLQAEGARMAQSKGMRVAYAAAPFDAKAVQAVLPYLDLLFLNQVEAEQLQQATGLAPEALPIRDVIVTLGGDGCRWYCKGEIKHFAALPVTPVDTTGAGDTFTGYVLAGLDRGLPMAQAITLATKAAALMVTRQGTADVIPDLRDVHRFDPNVA
ncbi:ribokinase [Tropicibacter naphthalenivorans]|uniref:Ribokinase n=1 Tax=Tropicibacter naphthalenivorans TaxID=441103 RepID=A0A0N7M068_9RHOB|nr:ribokinase [Tropicibacter naphthalenivorans]CUH79625.1 Ribokinase [Tropicibacter naphthalenivorans]SMC73845.1 ribokinase [Tropicibacter naphthalenivorans]